MMRRILSYVLVAALSVTPVLGQSITPQIGGGIGQGFDGGISRIASSGGGGGGACTAVGGTSAIVGVNTVWSFQSSGTFTCSIGFSAQLLAVAGGGAGSPDGGGGGGGGGVCSTQAANCGLSSSAIIPIGATTITVGAGGVGGGSPGTNGGNTVVGSLVTATGGGGGGRGNIATPTGAAGGSGGGGGASNSVTSIGGSASPAGQGNAGGGNVGLIGANFTAGGGGGAGAVGGNSVSTTVSGVGGDGISNSITGTAQFYGPGGAGGIFTRSAGNAPSSGGQGNGLGGHGDGLTTVVGTAGTPNTGGGGGGGSSGGFGFAGGSGIVVISCATTACGNGAATFTGQVATRSYVLYSAAASTTGWNSRTFHYARTAITNPTVTFNNWYVASGTNAETSNTGTSLKTASIEYPLGTFTQVKWSGVASVTAASGATTVSDPVPVSIPNGAQFWVRQYQVNSTQVLQMTSAAPKINTGLGDATNNSNVDQTMSGTVVDSGSGIMIPPAAISAVTSKPAICGIGDSRMIGQGDTTADATGDSGYARLFGGTYAYINMGIPGILARDIVTGGAKRFALAKANCTHMFLSVGGNDLNNSITAPTLENSLTWLATQWPSLSHVLIDTQAPWTGSSNGWVNTANQSVQTWEAQRAAVNTFTSALAGYNQIVNVGGFDGNGTNGQFWNNPVVGGFQNTTDGVHENSITLVAMTSSGIFAPASVTYP